MGELLHLFDFNQGSMAKKVITHKRQVGGLEAPRNSLEFPVEASQYYNVEEDIVPYSYQVKHEWSEKNSYPTEASMKKLISEEISKGPKTKRSGPSVVARLMGMDMLPIDTKSVAPQVEKKGEKSATNVPQKERNKKGSDGHINFDSNYSRQIDFSSFHHNKDIDPDRWSGGVKSKKPTRREHPQEEELQKFKKEFEAWQAKRFKECSKVVDLGGIPGQFLAQENLNKEKISFYANSRKMMESEKPKELKDQTIKARSNEDCGLEYHGYRNELFQDEKKKSFSVRSRTLSRDFEYSHLTNFDQRLDVSSGPTKIVILRPGPDRISANEESWASSSGASEERGSIEDFLEEVKERLRCELQGKSPKRGTLVRGGGIETPYSEKPSDTKQIAQRIAKQVRDGVTRDLGMNLIRSESTRSYRSEIQFNGPGSPEFINRDTRRLVSERLRNVLKSEAPLDVPKAVYGNSRYSSLDKQSGNKVSFCNRVKDEPEIQTRSFRCGPNDDEDIFHRELSPRNLIRSLSAPVSGTSFGKLLLEDRHILTGAHIRRKHEVVEKVTVDVKKRKKERFNLKERVSSFKYSFTLKGRLFGRKIQSVEESHKYGRDFMKDIMSGPTVVMNFGERHENCTEVPPSPASVCSSAHEELWRAADHLSSTSTSDPPPLEEDSTVPQVFREISSNLNELRRQLYQLGTHGSEEKMVEDQPLESEMVELQDHIEAYIRDLLVAAKLYDGSSDKVLSRWDPLAKPMSNHVFEEVEESYMETTKYNEGSGEDNGEKKLDRRVLFDLLNEALSIVLGPPVTMSRFRKKAIGHMLRPPHGRKLLDRVWEIIQAYVYPPTDKFYYLLDSMVARDLGSIPWSGLMKDEVDALGKEVESQIIRDLIEEIVNDIHS